MRDTHGDLFIACCVREISVLPAGCAVAECPGTPALYIAPGALHAGPTGSPPSLRTPSHPRNDARPPWVRSKVPNGQILSSMFLSVYLRCPTFLLSRLQAHLRTLLPIPRAQKSQYFYPRYTLLLPCLPLWALGTVFKLASGAPLS